MKNHKRAERRRHNKRLLKKRFQEERTPDNLLFYQASREQDDRMSMRRAKKRLSTNTMCSCPMCGSERKLYGNGCQGKTLAERRVDDTMKDDMVEYNP